MAVSIEWLVNQQRMNGIRILAGAAGTGNQITTVNIIDNPDMIRWLKGGELILSAGYFMDSNLQMQQEIIRELHKRGCAGLGIKLKRYLDEVPETMVRQADQLGFPILELPYERSFAEVNQLVYQGIFERDMTKTERISAVYRRLTEVLIQEHTVDQLLAVFSEELFMPVVLVNPAYQLIAYECSADLSDVLSRVFTLGENQPVFPPDRVDELIREYGQRHFEVDRIAMKDQGRELFCVTVPVLDDGALLGYLCIPELNRECRSAEYELIQAVKSILSLELLRYNLKLQGRQNMQDNFLKTVLYGPEASAAELAAQCELYGFDYHRKRVCSVILLDEFAGLPVSSRKRIKEAVLSGINRIAGRSGAGIFQLSYNNHIILYYLFSVQEKNGSCVRHTLDFSGRLAKELENQKIYGKIGVSRCYAGADTIREGFTQCIRALKLGARLHTDRKVYSYDEDAIYHLLDEGVPREHLKELYEGSAAVLERYDRENKAELVKTLKGYFEHNQNLSMAAQALYIHRNTMSSRMEKIKEILATELDDYQGNLRIQLGIFAGELLKADH